MNSTVNTREHIGKKKVVLSVSSDTNKSIFFNTDETSAKKNRFNLVLNEIKASLDLVRKGVFMY